MSWKWSICSNSSDNAFDPNRRKTSFAMALSLLNQELHKRAEEHYQIGLKFYSQGQYRDARKEFLTALRHNPDHADAKDKLTATKKEIEHVQWPKSSLMQSLQCSM